MNADVRSGGKAVRGATKCIAASHLDAAICVKENCYKIMRDNYRVSEVPVHTYECSSSDVALKNYSKRCSKVFFKQATCLYSIAFLIFSKINPHSCRTRLILTSYLLLITTELNTELMR